MGTGEPATQERNALHNIQPHPFVDLKCDGFEREFMMSSKRSIPILDIKKGAGILLEN